VPHLAVTEILTLRKKYGDSGIVLDTGPLALLIAGTFNSAMISGIRRLSAYGEEDYFLLRGLLESLKLKPVVTPQILAELSNISRQGIGSRDARFPKYFEAFVAVLRNLSEKYTEKDILLSKAYLPEFGFSDSSIAALAEDEGMLVLTDDLPLMHFLDGMGLNVLNFTRLRTMDWQTAP